jgi:hypothetical protein
MKANNKTLGGLFAIGFAVVVIVLLTPWLAVRVVQAAPPVSKPTSVCEDVKAGPRYMAYDKATKTDNFGPAVKAREVSAVKGEFHKRVCTDAALTAAEAAYFNLDGFTFQNYADKARQLSKDHDAWRATVQQLDNVVKDAQSVTVERSQASYNSLWFTHGANPKKVPALKQGPIGARESVVMKVVSQSGKVYMLRLECGFQPFGPNFPNVPPVQPPSQPKPPPPVHHGPCVKPPKPGGGGTYVYNPNTCTWHKPPQSFDQMQNQSPAHQDVQDNHTSGVNTGGTPNAGTGTSSPTNGGTGTALTGGGSDGSGGTTADNPPVDTGQGGTNDGSDNGIIVNPG